jgi:hypothetical protein
MRLSAKSKLLKKTTVGAASSRDRFNQKNSSMLCIGVKKIKIPFDTSQLCCGVVHSRLEAAPTNIQYTGSFQITGKLNLIGFGQRNLFCLELLIYINKMLIEYEHNVYDVLA